MICSSLNLLFFMSVILPKDGLHYLYIGTAGGEQVSISRVWLRRGLSGNGRCDEGAAPVRLYCWQQFVVEAMKDRPASMPSAKGRRQRLCHFDKRTHARLKLRLNTFRPNAWNDRCKG